MADLAFVDIVGVVEGQQFSSGDFPLIVERVEPKSISFSMSAVGAFRSGVVDQNHVVRYESAKLQIVISSRLHIFYQYALFSQAVVLVSLAALLGWKDQLAYLIAFFLVPNLCYILANILILSSRASEIEVDILILINRHRKSSIDNY